MHVNNITLSIVFFLQLGWLSAQDLSLIVYPYSGIKLQPEGSSSVKIAGPSRIYSTPFLGIGLELRPLGVGIAYQKESNLTFAGYENSVPWSIHELFEEDEIHLFCKHRIFTIGLGHYWSRVENINHHENPGAYVSRAKGIQLLFATRLAWIDVEFRSKVQYSPDFSAVLSPNNSICFKASLTKVDSSHQNKLIINGLIGSRIFINDSEVLPGEDFNTTISLAPLLGLEVMFNPIKTSLNLEKDWWITLNGGSPNRDVKTYVASVLIGLRHHFQLKNSKHLRVGLGASYIEDLEIKRNSSSIPVQDRDKVKNWQVKGLGISLSYELFNNCDLELKTTLPFIGEEIFERISRTSVGIIYRHNPLR
jgi:hypothetical protein